MYVAAVPLCPLYAGPGEEKERVDEILIFHALDKSQILNIVGIQLRRLEERLKAQDISLEVTDQAKQYIAEGTHSFAEISELLGYDTPQYFSQQFRRVAGMSPSAYARSVGETGILG